MSTGPKTLEGRARITPYQWLSPAAERGLASGGEESRVLLAAQREQLGGRVELDVIAKDDGALRHRAAQAAVGGEIVRDGDRGSQRRARDQHARNVVDAVMVAGCRKQRARGKVSIGACREVEMRARSLGPARTAQHGGLEHAGRRFQPQEVAWQPEHGGLTVAGEHVALVT